MLNSRMVVEERNAPFGGERTNTAGYGFLIRSFDYHSNEGSSHRCYAGKSQRAWTIEGNSNCIQHISRQTWTGLRASFPNLDAQPSTAVISSMKRHARILCEL